MRSNDSGKQPHNKWSAALVRAGWTSGRLASAIGWSRKAVESWRSGARRPSEDALECLAEVLGMAPGKILRLIGERHEHQRTQPRGKG